MFCAVKIKKKSFSKSKITYIVPNSLPHGSRHSRHNVYPQRLMGSVLAVQRVRPWTLETKFFSSDGNPDKKPDPESKRYWREKLQQEEQTKHTPNSGLMLSWILYRVAEDVSCHFSDLIFSFLNGKSTLLRFSIIILPWRYTNKYMYTFSLALSWKLKIGIKTKINK